MRGDGKTQEQHLPSSKVLFLHIACLRLLLRLSWISLAALHRPGLQAAPQSVIWEQVLKPHPHTPTLSSLSLGHPNLNKTTWVGGAHADGKIHTWLERELYLYVLNSRSSRRINSKSYPQLSAHKVGGKICSYLDSLWGEVKRGTGWGAAGERNLESAMFI